jgi:hypothetical protein
MLLASFTLVFTFSSLVSGVSFSTHNVKRAVEADRARSNSTFLKRRQPVYGSDEEESVVWKEDPDEEAAPEEDATFKEDEPWYEKKQEDIEAAEEKHKKDDVLESEKYQVQANRMVSFGIAIEETVGFKINWILFKLILGFLLLLPSMPNMIMWEAKGNPPHPFILPQEAVPNWRASSYDLCQVMALVGIDLLFLGGLEYNWQTAVTLFRFFITARAVQGFIVFTYGVTRGSTYRKESEEKKDTVTIIAENRFQDFTTSLVHISVLIAAQMTFMKFYTWEMTKPMPFTARSYVYWLAAVPMQVVARGLMGRSFCHECTFWHTMLHIRETDIIKAGELDDEAEPIDIKYSSVVIRSLMSFYVNNLSMAWIALSLPVFTMSAPTDIDFVKDCFAIVFITTLDDLPDNVTLTVQRVKERLQRSQTSMI